MLSLSFCILLLASLFHTMTKVKYKFNISLSNNAYSWCNIQDSNFMRRFRNFKTLILPLMIYFWEDVTNILFAESKRWNLRWKRKFYRRNWLWPFTSDAMLFVSPGFGLKHWQRRAGNDSSPREGSGVKLEVVSCKITLQPEASI